MVDEAHATGVVGATGGVAEHLGVAQGIDIRVGTLSKALGGRGLRVRQTPLIDWLVNRAGVIFSTAPPAAACGRRCAALRIVRDEPERRLRVLQQSTWLRAALAAQGWDVGRSESQIIPLMVGETQQAVMLAERLFAQGFDVPAIRPPSVPAGQSRLRISLSAAHDATMLNNLAAAWHSSLAPLAGQRLNYRKRGIIENLTLAIAAPLLVP